MDFVLFVVAWLAGGIIGAFTVGQVLLIARTGLPTAISWNRRGWLTSRTPIYRYISALVFLSVIFCVLSYLFVKFFSSYADAYFIGVGIAFLYALSKSGSNPNNIADFVQFNLPYINHAKMDSFFKELGVDEILRTGKKE